MLLLRSVKNARYVRELYNFRVSKVCFQSTNTKAETKEIRKSRKFLRPVLQRELKQENKNFVATIFSGSFEREIFEYPQVFEENDISTIINHSSVLENFLKDNPKINIAKETVSEFKKLELFGLSVPQQYGGPEYNRTEINFLLECSSVEPQIGRFLGYNEDYGCRLLNIFGNEEQKAKYLPRLAEGQSFISFAFLEAGPMIDFSSFEGHSVTDIQNNGYILCAKKKWVHNADMSDLFLVLAKRTTILEEEDSNEVNFNVFIVDRNTPGVSVHKVLANNFEEFNFFEVDFNDVFVPEKNLLGDIDTSGVIVLKSALTHGFLTDAVLCCSLIKQLIHSAYAIIHEKQIFEKLGKGYIMTQNNLADMTMNAYVLESVVYLLSGRFDTHETHDLFEETVLGKIMAIEMLKSAFKSYIEIVGSESLKETGISGQALKIIQYYSLMDENIEYLKMMVGGSGICYASSKLANKVKKLRNPHDNFSFALKEIFKLNVEQKLKLIYQIKQELHSSLGKSGDLLETSLCKFLISIEDNFISKGQEAIENEHILIKFAEIAAYLYAMTACLSRASSSICYDFPKCEIEAGLADHFTYIAHHKIESLIEEEVEFFRLTFIHKDISEFTFRNKGYPADHPLTRTF